MSRNIILLDGGSKNSILLLEKEFEMSKFSPHHGISTISIQAEEAENPKNAHVAPIFQSSIFLFPDVNSGQKIFSKDEPGYYYSRNGNPNTDQFAKKVAILEGIDLIRARPNDEIDNIVAGKVFSSGMAAITSAILAKCNPGDTVISQDALYSHSFTFLNELITKYGLNLIWVKDLSNKGWEIVINDHPGASLVYIETPANPTMSIVDIQHIAELAHNFGSWVMVDNTFATPYCQRPLSLGADLVVHSTTKYLSGHGLIIGGVLISPHVEFIGNELQKTATIYGASPSPFDTWLANIGLKTFGVRMEKHCQNALKVAGFLSHHPKVERVNYPGLVSFPYHQIAEKQMSSYGGMISFELKAGYEAGKTLMNSLKLITLAVSLGNIDSLIEHPASMTHHNVQEDKRREMGISDGLVRFSVGIENVEDIIEDLDQGLLRVG